ncbi:hypothetical protein GRI38_07990 [Altererythrobacter aurantiacus]|uniref:Uncharacterized protein n=2 Tax=Parapontixanthobacter aurantiacus TaxID=1463599 RepID=A0A844ZF98_9SPHN|nr:hypothetical protein [Parapontixanthobacter aurantiacus]
MQSPKPGSRWKVWGPWLGIVMLLSIPFLAMQITGEVNWDETDFIVMGSLLAFFVGTFQLFARTRFGRGKMLYIGFGLLIVFLYIWAELAVGIFNIPGISGS